VTWHVCSFCYGLCDDTIGIRLVNVAVPKHLSNITKHAIAWDAHSKSCHHIFFWSDYLPLDLLIETFPLLPVRCSVPLKQKSLAAREMLICNLRTQTRAAEHTTRGGHQDSLFQGPQRENAAHLSIAQFGLCSKDSPIQSQN